ncbi:hypothetical protein ACFQWF_26995 [Methylorubrum suomiense]
MTGQAHDAFNPTTFDRRPRAQRGGDPLRRSRDAASPARGRCPRGQILLFTGVRYERLPDADAPAVPQRRRS